MSSSDCIFCKIASKDLPSELVYEDNSVVAFSDTTPQAPKHVLVIPREHVESIMEFCDAGSSDEEIGQGACGAYTRRRDTAYRDESRPRGEGVQGRDECRRAGRPDSEASPFPYFGRP